ncbi:LysR family transcriptional regulator [Kitasatospora sp. KL5]|uniref:LysR family transcriptional regulator n=1 Tax=Kitasatospora sp. KL5 TaxID=3425125 RepID=UPI003D6F7422
MQLQQLRYFTAVAELGNFTRAAERLHVAQPSLSQQIKALERELGAELLHRTRGATTPTDAGEALLPLARRILADTDSARLAVQETVQLRRGRVRLGAPPSLCVSLLPDVLGAFRGRFPGVDLQISEGGSGDLVAALDAGELDLALIVSPSPGGGTLPTLAVTPLLHEDLVLVSARPLPHQAVAVEELRDRPLVMFRTGYALRDATLAACREAGFEPRFAVEGGEMDAVLGFVRAGLGPAVVPAMVAARSGLPTARFTGAGLGRTVSLAHGRDIPLGRAADRMRATVAEQLAAQARRGELPEGTRLLAAP